MPLSRLSPRSHRKGLASRGKKSSRSGASSGEGRSRHLSLWEAIRLTREELQHWKALTEHVEKLFRELILPREKRITNTLSRLTGSLIDHFDNPERNSAERSLLGLWIIQNFDILDNHPFASVTERKDLHTRFSAILDVEDPIESQLIRLLQRQAIGTAHDNSTSNAAVSVPDKPNPEQQTAIEPAAETADIVFDFGWHKKPPPIDKAEAANATQPGRENNHHTHRNETEDESDFIDPAELDERIKKSEKSLSLDRLFRQLAKVLHPDREQNDVLKVEKHLLMSRCLEARQKKDIDTLLQLYCEHVGDLPEDLTDSSHQELISALELQLKLLQRELRQQRFGDALLTQVVERYADSTNHKIEAKVASHAKQLDQELRLNEAKIVQLTTNSGLETALQQRRSIELDRMTIDEITGRY